MAETVGESLERISRETSPVLGQVCIALERRRIRPDTLREWAAGLRRGAADLERLADRVEKKS